MSNDSNNSPNGAERTKAELEQVRKMIGDKGYDLDRLAVLFLGGSEMLIGEVDLAFSQIVGEPIILKNPKRFMRIQQLAPQGVAINIFIGDLDCVDEGKVHVMAHAGYWIKDLGEKSQVETLKLFSNYFEQKVRARAAEAGLSFPSAKEVLRR